MSVRVGWLDAAGGWLGSTGWDCSEDEERECFSAIRMAEADFWDCCDSIGARYRSVVAAKVAGGEPPGGWEHVCSPRRIFLARRAAGPRSIQ
jgi:hypothetical protein